MKNDWIPSKQSICKLQGYVQVRINLPLFSTVFPSNSRLFLSCRPFAVIKTFSTGIVGVEVTSVAWAVDSWSLNYLKF